jgi:hypothetical protein
MAKASRSKPYISSKVYIYLPTYYRGSARTNQSLSETASGVILIRGEELVAVAGSLA